MDSWEAVLAGLVTALRTIVVGDGFLRVYDYPSDKVEAPAVVIGLPEVVNLTLNRGSFEWTMPIWLFISKANDRASAREVIPYLDVHSDKSIQAAIEQDRTLGGACDSVAVTIARPQIASVAGQEFLAIEFTLEVIG